MFQSPPATVVFYALAAFYWVVGVEILLRALTPSCRICVHRKSCPNRNANHPSEVAELVCLGEAPRERSREGVIAKAHM